MPFRTFIARKKSVLDFKASKHRIQSIALVSANVTGKIKLVTIVIYYFKYPRVLKCYSKSALLVLFK